MKSQRERNIWLKGQERVLIELPKGGDVRMAVAYPNRYWLAMSNLGFQTIYRLFASEARYRVDRAYLPEEGDECLTFESNETLSNLELLAMSVSFETDYLNALSLLSQAGLNLEACREVARTSAVPEARGFRPFLLGGGAALTLNPEPLANFFDAICIGEGEETVLEFSEIFLRSRDEGWPHNTLLQQLANVEGLYVPALYRPNYASDGRIVSYQSAEGAPARPKRRYVADIDRAPAFTVIQTPQTEFKSMFMTETGRGCEVGCRFCVAGYMYRPTRKHSAEAIRDTLKVGLEASPSVGFVGAAVSSHRNIAELARDVAAQGKRAALSSIMSQKVSPELAESLTESEYKTVALAPEAGTETLRFRIGKRVRDEQIVAGVETLARSGIRHFKLYFIVGLPSETPEDVEAIPQLVGRCAEAALAAAREQDDFKIAPTILLSVNPFIPKAWTPFQRHEFLAFAEVKRRLDVVRRGIRAVAGVEMKCESPRESYFQALMSRGDRRVGDMLLECRARGADWKWLVATGEKSLGPELPPARNFVLRRFGAQEMLPWEVVDLRIDRSLLEREYERTFEADTERLIAIKAQKLEGIRA